MSVVFSEEALADLVRIGETVAAKNPPAAAKIVARLLHACRSLDDMPLRYPLVPRHELRRIRRRPQDNFLIFYEVDEDYVRIVHILPGAMDYEPLIFPAG